jgi:hypothetical protein
VLRIFRARAIDFEIMAAPVARHVEITVVRAVSQKGQFLVPPSSLKAYVLTIEPCDQAARVYENCRVIANISVSASVGFLMNSVFAQKTSDSRIVVSGAII